MKAVCNGPEKILFKLHSELFDLIPLTQRSQDEVDANAALDVPVAFVFSRRTKGGFQQ